MRLDPESGVIQWQYLQTHLLRNPIGQPLVGSLEAHAQDLQRGQSEVGNATEWTAFDPEGLRCLPGNQVLLSDEYGPRVIVVNDQGSIVKRGDVPDLYRLRPKSGDEFTIGTFPNRGFEGIAVNADRKGFLAALQSPLIQDGVIENGKCLGLNCRWWLRDQGRDRQIVYRLETEKTGVSEVLAVDANRYIVLERDSEAGEAAAIKRLYLIDIQSATDVSQIERLPRDELPADVQAVKKNAAI